MKYKYQVLAVLGIIFMFYLSYHYCKNGNYVISTLEFLLAIYGTYIIAVNWKEFISDVC